MRGLEGVWRGASRHQSLIIYRPTTSSPFHHNSSYHHTSLVRSGDEEWRDEKCGSEEAWSKV